MLNGFSHFLLPPNWCSLNARPRVAIIGLLLLSVVLVFCFFFPSRPGLNRVSSLHTGKPRGKKRGRVGGPFAAYLSLLLAQLVAVNHEPLSRLLIGETVQRPDSRV